MVNFFCTKLIKKNENWNQMISNWILIIRIHTRFFCRLTMRTINIINEMKNWFLFFFNHCVRIDKKNFFLWKCGTKPALWINRRNVLGKSINFLSFPLSTAVYHRDFTVEKIFIYIFNRFIIHFHNVVYNLLGDFVQEEFSTGIKLVTNSFVNSKSLARCLNWDDVDWKINYNWKWMRWSVWNANNDAVEDENYLCSVQSVA